MLIHPTHTLIHAILSARGLEKATIELQSSIMPAGPADETAGGLIINFTMVAPKRLPNLAVMNNKAKIPNTLMFKPTTRRKTRWSELVFPLMAWEGDSGTGSTPISRTVELRVVPPVAACPVSAADADYDTARCSQRYQPGPRLGSGSVVDSPAHV